MISPEILRRYPFFAGMTDVQLKAVAMLAVENNFPKGVIIFRECEEADHLYILREGNVDLFYRSQDERHPSIVREFFVGEINPGEVFGTSAIIEPYVLNATARTSSQSRVIEIDAVALRTLLLQDNDLGNKLYLQVIKTQQERIMALRVQLATTHP